MTDTANTELTTCAACGETAAETPWDWVRDVEATRTSGASGQRVRHYCAACARTNLRGIEAGLDPSDW